MRHWLLHVNKVHSSIKFPQPGEKPICFDQVPLHFQDLKFREQIADDDLGERMQASLVAELSQGATKVLAVMSSPVPAQGCERAFDCQVVLIGSDIPDISTAILQAAIAALDTYEVRTRAIKGKHLPAVTKSSLFSLAISWCLAHQRTVAFIWSARQGCPTACCRHAAFL